LTKQFALDPYLAWQLVCRNALYQRRAWAAVATAVVEPVIYFAAVVVGLSQIVDARDPKAYAMFAGPSLMAVTAMNGAIVECTNNVFFRWRQGRLYDSALCTPMSAGDIALGDLMFGTLRGWLYGTTFLVLLVIVTGQGPLAVLCSVLAAALIAWMFAAIGLVIVTVIGTWRQLQYVHLSFFVMLMTANTFVDTTSRGTVLRILASVMPLTYASDLARACSRLDWSAIVLHTVIISVISVLASVLAIRRLSRKLAV
jgi:lipooligosaccharide transport system permease protein